MRRANRKRLPVVALVTGVLVAAAIVASGGLATAVTGPVVVGGSRPADVAISGDRVVWSDQTHGHYDIYLFDGSTGDTTRVTTNKGDQIQPDIDGDFIVWTDYRDGDADIWIYDITTGVQSELTEAANDQIDPTISGSWIAWEDYRSGYTPGIYAMDLGAPVFGGIRIAYGSNQPKRHPVVDGDLLVWEDFSGQPSGRGDPDVLGVDLSTFDYRNPEYLSVATDTNAHERAPWTDGRYVVYSMDDGDGSDVWAWDSATDETFALSEEPGEQAGPVASDGVAYWLVNDTDSRLHYEAYDFETGRTWTFNSYGTADMAGFDASGGNAAWLESSGGEWKVRAVLNDEPEAAIVTAIESMPARLAWVPHRLADIVASADDEMPTVLSATVEPGETQVEADRTLAVYFSEDMDIATFEDGAVTLVDDATGETVAAEVDYSGLADAVTVVPEEPLGEGSYSIAVSGAVADEAGNMLGQDYIVSFSRFVTFNADTTPPSRPSLRDIQVVGLTDVKLTWTKARDNVGIVGYHIYRYGEPMSVANIASAEFVDTVVGANKTKGTVSVAVDERLPRKYTYYYAIRAYDAEGNLSDVSTNMTPDPHGTYVLGGNTNNCMMCHSVHGVTAGRADLNAKSAEACYECHGDTDALSTYGFSSSIDEEYDFYSDDGDAGMATATRHYNDYMMASQAECDSCHTPHRRPAMVSVGGVKDDAASLSKILKRPVDPSSGATEGAGVYNYSTDAAPFGNEFCGSCHGVESAYMTSRGGNNAYSDAGGDHDTGFDAGAHGSTMVLSSTRATDDPGPAITCYACHNEHATQTRGLTDWRQSGVRDATYDQAGLCFACHSASYTAETRTNSSDAFFAWNGRNVQAEFGKASSHPYAASGGSTQTVQSGLWQQTTEAEFATDALTSVQTTDVGNGGVALVYTGGSGSGRSVSDDFDDDTFDTGLWTDVPTLGGSTDPDAGGTGTATLFTDDFNSALTPWTVTNAGGAVWDRYSDHNVGAWPHSSDADTELRWIGDGDTAAETCYAERTVSLPGNATAATLEFDRAWYGFEAGETLWIRWSSDGGSSFDGNQSWDLNADVAWTTFSQAIPADTDFLQFQITANYNNEQVFIDDLTVSYDYTTAPTNNWPAEASQQLTLRGEGADFWNANDEGDFVYTSSAAAAWYGSEPWETVVRAQYDTGWSDAWTKSGIMLRTGSDVAAATAGGAKMLGVFLTRDNGVVFAGRTTAGGNSTNNGTAAHTASNGQFVWLKLINDGAGSFTAEWAPDSGGTPGTWTQVGTAQALTLDATVLQGLAITSHTNDTFDDGTFDDFSVTEVVSGAGATVTAFYDGFESGDWNNTLGTGGAWTSVNTHWWVDTSNPSAGTYNAHADNPANDARANWYITKTGLDLSALTDITLTYDIAWGGVLETTDDFRVQKYRLGSWQDVRDYNFGAGDPQTQATFINESFTLESDVTGLRFLYNSNFNDDDIYLDEVKIEGTDPNAGGGTGPGSFGSPGDVVSTLISIGSGTHQGWGEFTFNGSEPGTTTIRFSVLDSGGVPITGFENFTLANSPVDLSTIDENTYPTLKVKADLTGGADSPVLTDWSVGYSYLPPAVAGDGQLTCSNCHNTHVIQTGGASTIWDMDRVSDPDNTKNIYTGTVTEFCLECHDGATPTAQMSASTIVPYSVGMTDYSSKPFFPGWDKSGFASNAHMSNGTSNMSVGCESCHDPHGSDNDRLVASTIEYSGGNGQHYDHDRDDTASVSSEEELCFNCHTNDRTPNCEGGSCHAGGATTFDDLDLQTPLGQTYGHGDVMTTVSGNHSDLEEAGDLASYDHVECVDCHDPHSALDGLHSQGSAVGGSVLTGAFGVVPAYGSSEWAVPTGYSVVEMDGSTDYEAYVCFKCHSDYTTLPTTGGSGNFGSTNLALEFNPENESGHNVMGNVWPKTSNLGASDNRTWTFPPNTTVFKTGWTSSSQMTCSDCHTWSGTGASGPHGSSVKYMIDSNYTGDWETAYLNRGSTNGASSNIVCNKCHNNFVDMNDAHREHDDRGSRDARCTGCHIKVPHGWKRPRLLGYRSDPAPYASDYLNNLTDRSYTYSNWSKDYCGQTGCGEHNTNSQTPYWP